LRAYSALFILPSALGDAAVKKAMQQVRDEIGKLGGVAEDTETMSKRSFARPMGKQDAGHYVKLRFNFEPHNMDALLARLKLNEDIFRVQMLRDEEACEPVSAEKDEVQDDG